MGARTIRRQLQFALLMISFLVASAQEPYFPKGALGDFPQSDNGRARWYQHQLLGLEEPSLLAQSKNITRQAYRFVWLRTFHHPVAIRLDLKPDGAGELTTKVGTGTGGYDPGHVATNAVKPLTKEHVKRLLSAIQAAEFWNLPSYEQSGGHDGARWIVEGIDAGKYHVVDRWSPGKGPVRTLGLLFIDESGLKIPKGYVY